MTYRTTVVMDESLNRQAKAYELNISAIARDAVTKEVSRLSLETLRQRRRPSIAIYIEKNA